MFSALTPTNPQISRVGKLPFPPGFSMSSYGQFSYRDPTSQDPSSLNSEGAALNKLYGALRTEHPLCLRSSLTLTLTNPQISRVDKLPLPPPRFPMLSYTQFVSQYLHAQYTIQGYVQGYVHPIRITISSCTIYYPRATLSTGYTIQGYVHPIRITISSCTMYYPRIGWPGHRFFLIGNVLRLSKG